jgi:hypothetical protein
MRAGLLVVLAVLAMGFAPAPFPRPQKPGKGLYADTEIERLGRKGIKDLTPSEGLLLDVVPIGETKQRGEVFRALGIDERRLRHRLSLGVGKVVFLVWQASPSYNLSLMTAINDPANTGLDVFDVNRRVYGVRIQRRE